MRRLIGEITLDIGPGEMKCIAARLCPGMDVGVKVGNDVGVRVGLGVSVGDFVGMEAI
jgi:hypothetical protein